MATVNTAGVAFFLSNYFLKYNDILYNLVLGFMMAPNIMIYCMIVKYSGNKVGFILCNLIKEVNVVFVLILLAMLFYIDNIVIGWSAPGVLFPIMICAYISFDVIGGYFPKRLSQVMLILTCLLLCWNIFSNTLVKCIVAMIRT